MKKAIVRSIVIIAMIIVSIAIGISVDKICKNIDMKTHPLKYTEYVDKYSELYRVPKSVIYSVIKTESGFTSNAVSKAGAVGLMQLMPSTFTWLCEKQGEELDTGMLYDPETNIRYGTYYLSYLYEQFGLWETVYAAYNCGPGRVKEWQSDTEYADSNGILKNIPISETASYVKKVSKSAEIYEKLYFGGNQK